MMKNNYIVKFITLCLLVLLSHTQTAFAELCVEDEVKKIEEATKSKAKEEISKMHSAYSKFQSEANSYISSCNYINLEEQATTPFAEQAFTPPDILLKEANKIGVNLIPGDNFATYNYNWVLEIAPSKAGCYDKLQKIKSYLIDFSHKYDDAAKALYAHEAATADNCVCDENGLSPTCATILEKENTENSEESETHKGRCKSFTSYVRDYSERCPLCHAFEVILNTDAKISQAAWDATAKPLTKVVKIFFLVLLAFEALKTVGAMAGSKISSFLKGVFTIGLKIAITVLLLSNSQYIYGYFISPVISGGLDMGMAITQSSGASTCVNQTTGSTLQSGAFDPKLLSNIYESIKCFGKSAATTPAIARGLLCHSWQKTFPEFKMWISGIVMFIFGLMIWLAISFYLIDCTVQLGMLSALVPLLIAFWPFKMTQQYTAKGVKMMMNTFFNYVMIGIVMLLGTHITTFAVLGNSDYSINDLIDALNNNNLKELETMSSIDGMQILVLIACSIFALKLIANANSLADQFASGSGSDIGSKTIGGIAASGAKRATLGSIKLGGKIAGNVASSVYEGSKLQAGVNKTVGAVQGTWSRGWSKAGKSVGLGKYQNQQSGSGKNNTEHQQNNNDTSQEENNQSFNTDDQNTNEEQNFETEMDNDTEDNTPNQDDDVS